MTRVCVFASFGILSSILKGIFLGCDHFFSPPFASFPEKTKETRTHTHTHTIDLLLFLSFSLSEAELRSVNSIKIDLLFL